MVSQISYRAINLVSLDGSISITDLPNGDTDLEVAGGGGTPSAPVNSVQYNNAGAFGGSANFTYTSGTNTVSFGNITGSALGMTIQPLAPTSGSAGALTVQARAGVATNGAGGAVNLTAGAGVGSGVGGALNLTAGNAVSGVAGGMTFNAGDSSFSTGGALTFNAGDGANGGAISFTSGFGTAGGNMTFTAGATGSTGAGANGGNLVFNSGNSGSGANAGDMTFTAGSSIGTTFSGFRGGNMTFSPGSSDNGPAGEFACVTGYSPAGTGNVRLETGLSNSASGTIALITGEAAFQFNANAGNLTFTGGAAGYIDPEDSAIGTTGNGGGSVFTGGNAIGLSGTGGGFSFTAGNAVLGPAGNGGSFSVTAGAGVTANGSITLATVSGTSIQLADNGARQLGFFGVTPVAKPAPTASGPFAVLDQVVSALNSLGLISSTNLTYSASTPVTLTYAATITPTSSSKITYRMTMTGNLVINAPSGAADGDQVEFWLTASGGARTVTFTFAHIPTSSTLTSPVTIASGTQGELMFRYDSVLGAWKAARFVNGYT